MYRIDVRAWRRFTPKVRLYIPWHLELVGAALLQGFLAVRGEINQISNAKRYIAYTQFLRKSVSLYLRRRRAVRRARRADGDHGRNRKCRYAAHAEPRGPAPAKPAVRGTGSAVCAARVSCWAWGVFCRLSPHSVSPGATPRCALWAHSVGPLHPRHRHRHATDAGRLIISTSSQMHLVGPAVSQRNITPDSWNRNCQHSRPSIHDSSNTKTDGFII